MDIKSTDSVTNDDQTQIKNFYSNINIKDEIEIKEEPFPNEDCSESEDDDIEIKEEPLFPNEDCSENEDDDIDIKEEPLFPNEDCGENGEDFEQSSELNENQNI
ncbi:hypothetical protein Avbf_11217 [Armadillidium vulgare]|nr:hypothetical protein Avbf_11217 [Armadillidium vulgare]